MFSSDPFSGIVKYMVQVNKSASSSDSLRLISDMIITLMIPLTKGLTHWDQRDGSKSQLNRKRSLQSKGETGKKIISYKLHRYAFNQDHDDFFPTRIASLGGNKWTSTCLDLQAVGNKIQ